MKITLRLSESLLSIYREMGKPLKEIIELEVEKPATIQSILFKAGINPLLVPMITLKDKRIPSLNHIIEDDAIITLIGPLAGG